MNLINLQSVIDDFLSAFTIVDTKIVIFSLFLLLIGLLLLIFTVTGLWQKKLLSAGIRSISGTICLAIAVTTLLLTLNIHTYYRLTYEKPLVNLSFSQLSERKFQINLTYLDDAGKNPVHQKEYILAGDEWQLDARIIKWEALLQVLGFNAIYRLERLTGRYVAISDEKNLERTVYALADDRGLNIWNITRQLQKRTNWVDAYFGSATYLPMADGAEYTVSISQSGLVAKATNPAAIEALQNW